MEKAGKYTLEVGELYERILREKGESEYSWFGQSRETGLYFDSVDEVHTVIEIAQPEIWLIHKMGSNAWHKERVEACQAVLDHEEEHKRKREENNKRQEELVKIINSQPTEVVLTYPLATLRITRSEAQYDPKRSSNTCMGCSINLERDGLGTRNLWLMEFHSTNGRVLSKKFLKAFPRQEAILEDFDHIKEIIDDLNKGTYK